MSPEYTARMGSTNTTKIIKMRRILLVFVCFVLIFQACKKEEVLIPNEVVVDKIEFDVLDGILSFDKGADFLH